MFKKFNSKRFVSKVLVVALAAAALTTALSVSTKAAAKVGKVSLNTPVASVDYDDTGKDISAYKLHYSWKKAAGAAGYQYRYNTAWASDNKKYSKAKTTKKKTADLEFETYKTVKFQVRAYKVVNKKKVYGKWTTSTLSSEKVADMMLDYIGEVADAQTYEILTQYGKTLSEEEIAGGVNEADIHDYIKDIDYNGMPDLIHESGDELSFYYRENEEVKPFTLTTQSGSAVKLSKVASIKSGDLHVPDASELMESDGDVTSKLLVEYSEGTGLTRYELYTVSVVQRTFTLDSTYTVEYDGDSKFVKATKNDADITEEVFTQEVKTATASYQTYYPE